MTHPTLRVRTAEEVAGLLCVAAIREGKIITNVTSLTLKRLRGKPAIKSNWLKNVQQCCDTYGFALLERSDYGYILIRIDAVKHNDILSVKSLTQEEIQSPQIGKLEQEISLADIIPTFDFDEESDV